MTNLARLVGNSCSNSCQLGAGSNLFAMLSAARPSAGALVRHFITDVFNALP